jgi:hypothetical protein
MCYVISITHSLHLVVKHMTVHKEVGARTVVAIDPGAKGGIARISINFRGMFTLLEVFDMPNLDTLEGLQTLIHWLEEVHYDEVVLEVQRCRGGNSAMSTWNHARGYGKLEACIALGSDKPLTLVEPIVWLAKVKVVIGNPVVPPLKDTKARTWTLANTLFPEAVLTGARGRKKDGLADAICLGWYQLLQPPLGSLALFGSRSHAALPAGR